MPLYTHGLCVFGDCPGLPAQHLAPFLRLPPDLDALRAWVAASPAGHHLLTAVVAPPAADPSLVTALKRLSRAAYVVLAHPDATEAPLLRVQAFQAGARMVTNDAGDLGAALALIAGARGEGGCECPWCGLRGLSAAELWRHQPLYHIHQRDRVNASCPVCAKSTARLTRHISLYHGPQLGVDERTGVYALAVVRRPTDGKFLMVQERYREGFWLPGGGVDSGESLRQGAVREALEEAGADIVVTGILTIEGEHGGDWRRIIFLAEPVDAAAAGSPAPALLIPDPARAERPAAGSGAGEGGQPAGRPAPRYRCKSLPDVESAGACWVRAEELGALPLRSASEPRTWIPWVARGGGVLPLDPAAVPQLAAVFPDYPL